MLLSKKRSQDRKEWLEDKGNLAMSEKLEKLSLSQFSEKAYLDYSMYVILDRHCLI